MAVGRKLRKKKGDKDDKSLGGDVGSLLLNTAKEVEAGWNNMVNDAGDIFSLADSWIANKDGASKEKTKSRRGRSRGRRSKSSKKSTNSQNRPTSSSRARLVRRKGRAKDSERNKAGNDSTSVCSRATNKSARSFISARRSRRSERADNFEFDDDNSFCSAQTNKNGKGSKKRSSGNSSGKESSKRGIEDQNDANNSIDTGSTASFDGSDYSSSSEQENNEYECYDSDDETTYKPSLCQDVRDVHEDFSHSFADVFEYICAGGSTKSRRR